MLHQELFLTAVAIPDTQMGPVPPTIPAAPTGLAVTVAATFTIDWTNGDTYSQVDIFRSADGADFIALTTVAGNVETYEDTTVLPNVLYAYKVRGLKATFPSPYSNTDSGTYVPAALDAPSALTDTGSPAGTILSVEWTNNGPNAGAYDFIKIEVNFNGGGYTEVDSIDGSTNFWDGPDGMDNGNYDIRVRGKVGTDFSDYSNVVSTAIPHP